MDKRIIIINGHEISIGNNIVVNSNFLEIRKKVNFEKTGEFTADLCPICMHEILIDDTIQVVINNFKLFPNILVHKRCIDDQTDNRLIETMKDLTNSYNDFKELGRIWL